MVNDGPGADRDGQEGPEGSERPVPPFFFFFSPPPSSSGGPTGRWSRWRGWRPWVKPVRRVVLLFVLALVVEYLVVPELVGARKDLYLLNQVNGAVGRRPGWCSRAFPCSATRC